MEHSRRDFVAAGLAGVAGLCAAPALATDSWTAPAQAPAAGEDGYKLWLRYASLGDAATQYRRLTQLVVEGTPPPRGSFATS